MDDSTALIAQIAGLARSNYTKAFSLGDVSLDKLKDIRNSHKSVNQNLSARERGEVPEVLAPGKHTEEVEEGVTIETFRGSYAPPVEEAKADVAAAPGLELSKAEIFEHGVDTTQD